MRTFVALAVAACLAAPVSAEVVEIRYEGVVGGVAPEFASIATAGDPASGTITYDAAAADTDPDPASGVYPGATHTFHFGSFSGTSTQSAIRIFNDYFSFDAFQVIDYDASDEVGTIDGLPVNTVLFALNGSTDLYASDALPLAPPAFDDSRLFERYASIAVLPPGQGAIPLDVELTSVTVPEPSGAASLAVGALALLRRRSR